VLVGPPQALVAAAGLAGAAHGSAIILSRGASSSDEPAGTRDACTEAADAAADFFVFGCDMQPVMLELAKDSVLLSIQFSVRSFPFKSFLFQFSAYSVFIFWHCLHMRSRVYKTSTCRIWMLHDAAAGLLLWAQQAGDVSQFLHSRSSGVWQWNAECHIAKVS